ncbi:helix-turn-helix domain-containing protein [Ancylobacter sp. 6x-1]|uniref:Helix-turn-helix domain-containing protein n=1 Tax=Ancylobacter crimeensis TaxID=2579147 RepID=A0ABT0D5U2_9HYPH|nr:helix-turn-helix domain-containing protein [Ancylobacter crimeensis]MCK0195314.1 helix-turn-helix domain-containing protein [Ancylobacter crimeensis]
MYIESALSNHEPALRRETPESLAAEGAPSLSSLFARQPVERFEAGAAVFWEGDTAAHVFEVVDGVLRVFRMMNDGRRVITGFLYPGDLVGVSLERHYLYTAEAVTPVKLRRFARNRFQSEIHSSPELRPQLFAQLCDEMAAAQDQMVLLARKTAEERVASFLLVSARRLKSVAGAPLVEIPMTRLDMADYLGLTIETVSRTMTRLTQRGVIEPNGRHTILVRKLRTLAVLAGECDEDDSSGETGVPEAGAVRRAVWPH